jgi:hypothetical protein
MTPASPVRAKDLTEIEIFRDCARTTQQIVRRNLEGISHEESLGQPQPAGNCLNWVMGHLVCIYDEVLPLLGQKPVLGRDALRRYTRGAPQLCDAAEALPLSDLLSAWDEASARFDAGLGSLTPEKLEAPAPASPRKNPNETVRSFLSLISFHQAYHAGQTGLLRRMAGKEGALR